MKKRIGLILLAALLAAALLTACGNEAPAPPAVDEDAAPDREAASDAGNTPAQPSGDAIVIGVTSMTLKESVYHFMMQAAQDTAAEMGDVTVSWLACENDPTTQMNQVENFISQRVDVIVIEPARSDAARDMVLRCEEAGIPVINLEAVIWGADCPLRIASDAYKVGTAQVEDFLERHGADVTGKVAVLSGSKGDEVAETITQGNLDALEELAPGLEVVVQQFHENWDRQRAMNTMENALTQYGEEITAVFANNDTMAIGAMKAAENVGLDDAIMFYGADFDQDSCEMLLAGAANFAVLDKGALLSGEAVVRQGVKLARGEDPDVSQELDGIPTLWIPIRMVDKDNVAEIGLEKYADVIG